ncbi:UxaA family hydrolase [Pedobacter cryophilus]|uniref:Uncharacterized protein n=1 Tax=Pedobacter cryophilus TaxID=2571271 RepID=A0A4U1C0Z0_9SPHI|nr:UxaA family hydrolase [Pedobacter cryophilus]TKB99212.1 hypothetical protein FA046_08895 [Pedobacter cryophilus]
MALDNNFLQLDIHDNVLVALQDLPQGTEINFSEKTIILQNKVKAKHKFFINDMESGDEVKMYGVLVGKRRIIINKDV